MSEGYRMFFLVGCNGKDMLVMDIMRVGHRIPVDLFANVKFQKHEARFDDKTGRLWLRPKGSTDDAAWVDHCPWKIYDETAPLSWPSNIDLDKAPSARKVTEEDTLDL